MMKQFRDRRVSLIAHRGWSNRFPENSMPAFEAAIAAGADEIEFDVQTSRDGIPMVCHDKTTDRVSDLSGSINSFDSDELRAANIKRGDGDALLVGLGFPTLQEVLEAFYKRVIMNVHIKELDPYKTALHLLASLDILTARGIYIAGSVGILEDAREVCPHIARCLIQGRKDTNIEQVFKNGAALGCTRIQFYKGYHEDGDIKEARNRGFIPNLFWEDEPIAAEGAVKIGVLGLLTNDIGPIRNHLSQNGLL